MPSANKTVNLGLNQWLGNEFPKRQDFVDDNKKIDEAFANISTDANGTSFDNSTNGMSSTNVQDAIEENKTSILALQNNDGNLANLQTANKTNLVSAVNELFQSASSGKNLIATSVTGKGISASGSETFSSLAGKIDSIVVEKHNLPVWFNNNFWLPANPQTTSVRCRLTSSVVGDNIYTIGGSYSTNYFATNICYNTINNSWSTKTSMPTAREDLISETVGTNIYCMCGYAYVSGNIQYNKNECYDTLTDTWSTKANTPYQKNSPSSGVVGTNIYVFGGTPNGTNANNCYDTLTNTWSTKANMITARSNLASATVGTNIYAIGGSSITNINECYDTIANTWSTKASMPTARYQLTANAIGTKIYVVGGYATSVSSKNECYDTIANTWSTVRELNVPRYEHCASTVNNTIYCIDGSMAGNSMKINECYIP